MSHDIIYFHIGDSDYLLTSIKQLKHFNPDSRVHLIGRGVSEEVKQLVNFHDYENLMCKEAGNFLYNFKNYSTNDANFEKICILRWFLIKNLCIEQDITRFFCLDSDIMVYCNLSEELKKFDHNRYSLTHCIAASSACFNDITALNDYCDFVSGFYDTTRASQHFMLRGDKQKTFGHYRADLLNVYQNRINNNLAGGICDMTFWGELRTFDAPIMIGEMSSVLGDTTFDHNINSRDFFEYENGMKKITWIDGVPYCKNIFLDKMIRFNTLHFQGYNTKKLMKEYRTYNE
tara:strand:+ start:1174 stop:2040 length:867 start_codon:yes stop_codon:yes gene_type:complete